jgi:hypothetical protein
LDSRADRTVANNLAKGTEWAEFLRGVQVSSTLVRSLADSGNFIVVVEDFGREEVNFTRE